MNENKMGTMPIGKLLLNMALPMIASMMVQALYNVVDSIYISRVSESAVTALSLAFPVQNMSIALASGIAVGVNSLLSRSLGEKRQDMANKAAGNGITLIMIAAGLLMLFGIFGARPYYELQSNVEETVNGGSAYVSITSILCIGCFFQVLFERLLQSTGRTIYSMITQGTGAIINIILDPIFIFGYFGVPKMGVAGAAIATVIGQCIAASLAIYFNIKRNPDIELGVKYMKPESLVVKNILVVGIPSMVMMAIGSVMNFGMNQIFQSFSETATGVFGIYYKLQSFFFMPLFGMNGATISIVAYNYGAKRKDRMMQAVKIAATAAFCIMMAGLLAFQIIPQVLLGIFNPSDEFLVIGTAALRIISIHFPVAAFCIVFGAVFQALGNGIYSTVVSLGRQLVVLLPVAYVLSLTGSVNNVWWAFPIAEIASLILSVFFFKKIYTERIAVLPDVETA
ncbi:MAG: MATE family efflux transporter [Lachnospiraceae bacterium]|nr:MATE family efflux transporter [Lachnospiraceae bacterium]